MTLKLKQEKLEKKVKSSDFNEYEKARFNVAIKRAFNITTLKDVEKEIKRLERIKAREDIKTEIKKQRKEDVVKPLTPEQTREQIGKMVKVPVLEKDKEGKIRKVMKPVVAGDPKLKQIGVIKRQKIKPLSEAEIQKIQLASVRQKQDLMEAAALYQDRLKAQRFLASAFRGRIKPFPKLGYPISRIVTAYHKRKPRWRLRIRRNRREEIVYLKIVGPREKLAGRDMVESETRKILTLMNMRMHPSAIIEDVRPPVVKEKWAFVNIKVRATKIGEGEIRPRNI